MVLRALALLLAIGAAEAGSSDLAGSLSLGGGSKFGSSFSTEHVFADDLKMGATFKNNKVDTIYAKFHETYADIMVKMQPSSSKVTGTVDMKNGETRAVASFDKDFPGFITKIGLTSDKIVFGPVAAVLKPTYDAMSKLLDLDVTTSIKGAGITFSTSQVEGSASKLAMAYKFENGMSLTTNAASDAKFELGCSGSTAGHKLGGKMKVKSLSAMPAMSFGWSKGFGKASAGITADMEEATLEASTDLGGLGDWTTTLTTPYSAPSESKWSLSTKMNM